MTQFFCKKNVHTLPAYNTSQLQYRLIWCSSKLLHYTSNQKLYRMSMWILKFMDRTVAPIAILLPQNKTCTSSEFCFLKNQTFDVEKFDRQQNPIRISSLFVVQMKKCVLSDFVAIEKSKISNSSMYKQEVFKGASSPCGCNLICRALKCSSSSEFGLINGVARHEKDKLHHILFGFFGESTYKARIRK